VPGLWWIIRYPLAVKAKSNLADCNIRIHSNLRPPPTLLLQPSAKPLAFMLSSLLCANSRFFRSLSSPPFSLSTLSFRSISTLVVVTAANRADSLRFNSRKLDLPSEFRTQIRNNRTVARKNRSSMN